MTHGASDKGTQTKLIKFASAEPSACSVNRSPWRRPPSQPSFPAHRIPNELSPPFLSCGLSCRVGV